MDKSAASAYTFAKVCGMSQKAYIGENEKKLYAVKSLSELYSLLFKAEVPTVPEAMLAKLIESKAEKAFLDEFVSILNNYDKPEPILVDMLRFYDFENLKEIAGSLCMHESERPEIADIAQYSMLDYSKWPDIQKITAGSPLAWYDKIPDVSEQQKLDTRLDFQYMQSIWDGVKKLSGDIKKVLVDFFTKQIVVQNIIWAMRLKIYYKMDEDEIIPHLFFDNKKALANDILAGEAVRILSKNFSSWDEWKNWKYAQMLNVPVEGSFWEVDPSWMENSFRSWQEKKILRGFHRYSFTLIELICYFKIKQNELDVIRAVTENLRLGGD